ncbi:spore coat U domain-containing protein [Tsuneonella mangrovi]|uniref:Csu type fimbrial protein n=1 Tax=Tsuneonella mangrovi TaxID=1982042 RepID=UPI000BA1D034|nr:spore coat U domain-containing protein [Tsuneonella mangrovi]
MRKIAILVAAAAAVTATPSFAGTATGTVQVSLNVTTACSVTAQPLDFGSTTSLAVAIDSTSPTTVNCTPGAAYSVFVDYGANAGATTQRELKSVAGDLISYDIYSDSARTTAWTPSAGTTGVGDGTNQAITLYGRVPAQAAVPAGTYSDSVVVSVNY